MKLGEGRGGWTVERVERGNERRWRLREGRTVVGWRGGRTGGREVYRVEE